MKVKELIEQLQKQNPEDEIHIWVDDEVGCGAGFFGKYYATEINIEGHDKYFQNTDGELKSLGDLEEQVYDDYDYISDDDIKKEALILANQLKKLEGTWIKIQP